MASSNSAKRREAAQGPARNPLAGNLGRPAGRVAMLRLPRPPLRAPSAPQGIVRRLDFTLYTDRIDATLKAVGL